MKLGIGAGDENQLPRGGAATYLSSLPAESYLPEHPSE